MHHSTTCIHLFYYHGEVQNLRIQFDPQAVMADFELALVQSLEIQFPSAVIHGCSFYVSQCLHAAAALAFFPLTFVHVAWSAIKADAPGIQEADDFISYFESTWLDGNFPART